MPFLPFVLGAALVLSACAATPHAPRIAPDQYEVSYQIVETTDAARDRPLRLDIWRPSLENGEDAPIAPGRHAAVLFSHGSLGSANNYTWLGEGLARAGVLVIGVSHYGESMVYGGHTVDIARVTRMDDRAADLSFALDHVLQTPAYAQHIDDQRLGVVGHSAGGATALLLAGAKIDMRRMIPHCASQASVDDKSCLYVSDPSQLDAAVFSDLADPRVTAFALLDPAVGPTYDPASLSEISAPVFISSAVQNDFIPHPLYGGLISALIEGIDIHDLDAGEGHFVYLDVCDAPLEAMGVPLCKDKPGVDRAGVHAKLVKALAAFFDGAW